MHKSDRCEPFSTSRPSFITRIWSASTMLCSLCATTTVVKLRNDSSRTCSMDVSVSESSAEVGSSQSTIDGCVRRARAIATRCRSPPERPMPRSPTRVS
mmetsp:Transcript_30675/g.67184  ORF Transcript_30675/g.67184 Transcript_30675/m.67184 type:complete len:99 (-) Transcript_30675:1057-1353(-)